MTDIFTACPYCGHADERDAPLSDDTSLDDFEDLGYCSECEKPYVWNIKIRVAKVEPFTSYTDRGKK